MIEKLKENLQEAMSKAIQTLKKQLTKIRTGRASATILDNVVVDYYGSPTPISQVSQISTPEARLLQIQPFDKTLIVEIEKSIINSNLGLTPSNDGNLIRIQFPSLTEEKRKDEVKKIKKIGEESKITIRNIRREGNEKIKKSEKNKEFSEDYSKKYQEEVQTLTDKLIQEVDVIIQNKEQEILSI